MSDPRTGDLLSFCVPIGAAVAAGCFFSVSVPGSAVVGLLCRSSWPKNILCSSLEARQVATRQVVYKCLGCSAGSET